MSEQGKTDTSDSSNARKKRVPLSPEEQRQRKQERFLKAYRESGNIKHSCKVAHIARSTFYEWRKEDEAFAAALADADPEVNDTLEFAAYDRAVNGVPSFVVSQGHMVYEEIPMLNEDGTPHLYNGKQVMLKGKPLVERKYSDTLLVTLLKARMPEKYKDRSQHEHVGKDGESLHVHVFLPD